MKLTPPSLSHAVALVVGIGLLGPVADPVLGDVPDGIRRHIAEREYWASESAAGLQAPNRRHGLRTYFGPGGIRVVDRRDPARPELLALRVGAWGREEALAPAGEGALVHSRERVEIRRPGLVEWFVNRPEGLEHGFTVAEPPPGEGALVFELLSEGARVRLAGDVVWLDTHTGRSLRYSKLLAWDARGTAVGARFQQVSPDRVRLLVEDAGAAYPLTIDPLLHAAEDTRIQSDQSMADLGFSVASAGDVDGDGYDDILVGARSFDSGEAGEGAAFVFHGGPDGIVGGGPPDADTQLESDQVGGGLGISVASAGDVNGDGYDDVVVGAYQYDSSPTSVGAAFVFHGGAEGIASSSVATAASMIESGQDFTWLGASVSSAGDVNGDGYHDVIVGARYYTPVQDFAGAAFVYHGSEDGIAGGGPSAAAARLESDVSYSGFGLSVSSAGDVNGDGYDEVVVGAFDYGANAPYAGSVFVFHGGPTGVSSGGPGSATTQLDWNEHSGQFGNSVASAGDVNGDGYDDVIAGAFVTGSGADPLGAALVFHGGPGGIPSGGPEVAASRLDSDQGQPGGIGQTARFGQSVASAGDVNGDGYDDVIVGAPYYDLDDVDQGAAFLYFGGDGGIASGGPAEATIRLEGSGADTWFGWSVASAGDVDGDGASDVIVGAPMESMGQTEEGAAFLYLARRRQIDDLSLVPVGDPGNPPDVTGFGAVDYEFPIGTFEVTVREYVAFLDNVARDDVHGLFHEGGDPEYGVVRSGSPGQYTYQAVPGREDTPIDFVSLYDAMRFVNWLENGQPFGPQGPGTTEDGSYTISAEGIAANSISVEPGARLALPSEDEWYKAAHYDPVDAIYYASPAAWPTPMLCQAPTTTPNSGNCGGAVGDLTVVGSYAASPSPNGTFDQGGNVWEWTESRSGALRRVRGGGFDSPPTELGSLGSGRALDPAVEARDLGFRVVPEPGGPWPLAAGAAGLLALAGRRRRAAPLRPRARPTARG